MITELEKVTIEKCLKDRYIITANEAEKAFEIAHKHGFDLKERLAKRALIGGGVVTNVNDFKSCIQEILAM